MDKQVDLYKAMTLIRQAEIAAAEYYKENKIFSFVHFCVGQEAVAAGVGLALTLEDAVFGNHRSHGHYLAKGGNLHKMFAEMLGRETGNAKGKGGSMHMVDRAVNFLGTSPILSSAVPIAMGHSWSQKMDGKSTVTAVFTGDGASEEGNFYETLNLAALWSLPLLIVIEDNYFSVNTPKADRRPNHFSFESLCAGLGVDYLYADSSDAMTFLEAATFAASKVRKNSRPFVLHAQAMRDFAHSAPIRDEAFRQLDTEDVRRERDPIASIRTALIESKKYTRDDIEQLEIEIKAFVFDELEKAINDPLPHPGQLLKGIYA